jgi:hypothetical protein
MDYAVFYTRNVINKKREENRKEEVNERRKEKESVYRIFRCLSLATVMS